MNLLSITFAAIRMIRMIRLWRYLSGTAVCRGGGRFLRGDRIAVWGQPHGDGQLVVYDGESGRLLSYPGICMAYGAVVTEESS